LSLVTTNFGILIIGIMLMLLGFAPLNWINEKTIIGEVCFYTGMVGIGIIVFLTLKGLVLGWFNTAREQKEDKIIEERKKWY